MVNIYIALINKGLRTINEVPEKYREQIKKLLKK